ncbi:MFS transporter [Streptomyces chilikensis]|uniref:MFS transporter n=1 Tax=Streptomyces chilikensis TaxID=1194079 RepID=A0ABV3ELY1_9ACTN
MRTTGRTAGGGTGERRRIGVLLLGNLLGGVGVASGITVTTLLVERLGATELAGLGQAVGVLGAAVAAVPLARLAARRGRRWSLGVGYAIAVLGAALIAAAATAGQLALVMAGLCLFGVAQACNLQTRYAAADGVAPGVRARTMAVVVWATTVGSVAGPNLTAFGQAVGESAGVLGLAGPYLLSGAAFAAACALVVALYRGGEDRTGAPGEASGPEPASMGAAAALRWTAGRPTALFAVVLLATAHATMIMVMVMTPLHMQHHGMSLRIVGVVISVHIAAMYGLSPLFGRLADRWGPLRTAFLGIGVLWAAVTLGYAAASGGGEALTAAALVVLGLGWSLSTLAASALLAAVDDDRVRVPLQGAADAGMSYAGAAVAALAGPVLAAGGFRAVNLAGAALLLPALWLAVLLARRREATA